jgi:hypothetical protein
MIPTVRGHASAEPGIISLAHNSQLSKNIGQAIPNAADCWTFTDAELENSPSIIDKRCKDFQHEQQLRAKSAKFIQDCGTDLKIPENTVTVACLFMHRFYCRKSFSEFNGYVIIWN